MKRLIFVLSLSILSLFSFSQVMPVNATKLVGRYVSFSNQKVFGEILFLGTDKGGQYVWTYFNMYSANNPFINRTGVIKFNGDQRIVDELYKTLKSILDDKNDSKYLYIGNKVLRIYPIKEWGQMKLKIITNDGYFHINEKQLNKLFGKR